ncbi:PREDICTED: B3 domain-containing protein At3g18960-like [Camelina sativa]|uniref:B3 domain-containing protein At3g18960-like n=1 Tax=Camelina sativa TaxID=90675 RepID=A0ABM0XLT1_CAMSA|nr:PREDICTED: B3 domain-containing protein At3g18960-like [Camelina sativa]
MVTTRKTKARITSSSHGRPPQDPESPVKTFFKIILPSTMKNDMMKIPPTFVKLQGSKLPDVVTLETPVGFKRSIKLKRIGQEIWFHEGWSEFAEAHSIKEGHFLLFQYYEISSFRVIIFNVSACEIEYPRDAVHISDSDDDIIDITDERFVGTQITRGNNQSVNGGDTEHNPKKRPSDIEFDKILQDVDVISSIHVPKEEEDIRVFRG